MAPVAEFKKERLEKDVDIVLEGSVMVIIGAVEEGEIEEFSEQFNFAFPLIPSSEREEEMESWQFSGPE